MSKMMGGYKKSDSVIMMNSMMDPMLNPMLNSSQQMMDAQMMGPHMMDAHVGASPMGALPMGALPIGALPMGSPIGALPMGSSVGSMNVPPPININVTTGNNNKVTPPENPQQQKPDIFQSTPMIRMGGNSSANNIVNAKDESVLDNANTLETLGNGKGNFIVKKV
jgi:hypothetical protein